jgi:hypothetical protein
VQNFGKALCHGVAMIACSTSAAAIAAPYEIGFSGFVGFSLAAGGGAPSTAIPNGSLITGRFFYDTDTPDIDPGPDGRFEGHGHVDFGPISFDFFAPIQVVNGAGLRYVSVDASSLMDAVYPSGVFPSRFVFSMGSNVPLDIAPPTSLEPFTSFRNANLSFTDSRFPGTSFAAYSNNQMAVTMVPGPAPALMFAIAGIMALLRGRSRARSD